MCCTLWVEKKGERRASGGEARGWRAGWAGRGHRAAFCHALRVHSFAVFSYSALLVLYKCAISGTRGSSGLGSLSREQMDSRTLLMVRAGLLRGIECVVVVC